MDRLKHGIQMDTAEKEKHLHSNMDRLKRVLPKTYVTGPPIYIPIWID